MSIERFNYDIAVEILIEEQKRSGDIIQQPEKHESELLENGYWLLATKDEILGLVGHDGVVSGYGVYG